MVKFGFGKDSKQTVSQLISNLITFAL